MAVTIRDVAVEAGVSAMAVSKVLHGKGTNVRVGAETAETIRRVAEQLNYQPNRLARSFRQQKTNNIGLIFEHIGRIGELDGYFGQFLNGVMSATFKSDYSLTICPHLVKLSENGVINDGRFDGLLWCKPDYSKQSEESIEKSEIPIVMMHAPAGEKPGVPRFCCNNAQGLRLAVDHLVDLGHKRIAFVVDPVNRPTAEGHARTDGFLDAMSAHGLKATEEDDVLLWEIEEPQLDKVADHTALITFSEKQAVFILEKSRSFGISIPEDLSVV